MKNQNDDWILMSESHPTEKDVYKEFWVTYFSVDENFNEYYGVCKGVWIGHLFNLNSNYFARPIAWKPLIAPEPYEIKKPDESFIEFRKTFIKKVLENYEDDYSEDSIDELTAYHSFYDYYAINKEYMEKVYSEYLKTNEIPDGYLIPIYQIYLKNYCVDT